jgi:hypothetical protein
VCFLFNVMALFKKMVLRTPEPMLNRLRMTLFAVGASLGMEGGHHVLRVGLKERLRERFEQLLKRLDIMPSTASQLPDTERKSWLIATNEGSVYPAAMRRQGA